eukprot:366431-Chlamydomonas_euryale.AAC.12
MDAHSVRRLPLKFIDGDGKSIDGDGKSIDGDGKSIDGDGKSIDGDGKCLTDKDCLWAERNRHLDVILLPVQCDAWDENFAAASHELPWPWHAPLPDAGRGFGNIRFGKALLSSSDSSSQTSFHYK